MNKVHADLSMNDGAWWSLTSDTGYYDGSKRLLNLYGNIAVFSDTGYEMNCLSAEINRDTKLLTSEEKVWGHSSLLAITSTGLDRKSGVASKSVTVRVCIVWLHRIKNTQHTQLLK